MKFKLKELTVEHMREVVLYQGNAVECGGWVSSLPEDLRIYAADAVYKCNDTFIGQRMTEANRIAFIHSVLNEMRAVAHEHMAHNVTDSALLRAIE